MKSKKKAKKKGQRLEGLPARLVCELSSPEGAGDGSGDEGQEVCMHLCSVLEAY
jgi:hypothetical protein